MGRPCRGHGGGGGGLRALHRPCGARAGDPEEFDASLSQVGVLLASLWVGTIPTLLAWGLLADRLGERVVLGTGLGLCGVLATAAGFAGSFWMLLGVLFLRARPERASTRPAGGP